jgi:hypothetical protein
MNYTELYDAIIAETENTDDTFIATVPIFVRNAEKRIYQAVKIPALRKNQTSLVQASNQYLTLPVDYISAWEVAMIDNDGAYSYMLPKDVSYIREAYPNPTGTGLPKYYAQYDENTFLLGPTPSSNFGIQLHYFYYPASIVTATNTWLGDNFENVLLYGVLVEASVFMKSDEDIMKAYADQFLANLKLLKAYADGSLRSGPYRS